MPALVNMIVGSSAGTTGELGRTACPLRSKYSVNFWRISDAFMSQIYARMLGLRAVVVRVHRARGSLGGARFGAYPLTRCEPRRCNRMAPCRRVSCYAGGRLRGLPPNSPTQI